MSLLDQLYGGRYEPGPFPADPPPCEAFFDLTDEPPPDMLGALAAKGFLDLRDRTPYEKFQIFAAAGERSGAVALMLAVHNGLGLPAYLPLLPPGPLRDRVDDALRAGVVFATADTEPAGAANSARETVAQRVPGGYRITGSKVFIGNGRIAGLVGVTATVDSGTVDVFLADTADPGFSVVAGHRFVGLHGAPSAALRFDGVFVPAELRLGSAEGGWRASPEISDANALARLYITGAPALGLARAAVSWSRDFLARRRIDGRPLVDFEAVRRRAAISLAELYAIESAARYALLVVPSAGRWWERTALKNIATVLAWRIVERTVSLFGAEGIETAGSKADRGAVPVPLERAWRDVRCLRIAGGVDFQIDLRAGWQGLFARRYAGLADAGLADAGLVDVGLAGAGPAGVGLASSASGGPGHEGFVREQASRLGAFCDGLVRRLPADELRERQSLIIAANRLVTELYTMGVTLARASADGSGGDLAEIYCTSARTRIAALWHELESPSPDGPYAAVTRTWMGG